MLSLKAEFAAKQQKYAPNNREGRETNWGNDPFFRRQKDNRPRGKSRQQQMNEEAVMKERAKIERERERRASEPPKAPPLTDTERGTAKGAEVTAKKAKVALDEKDALYDKYGGRQSGGQGFEIPYITPVFRSVGNTIRDKVVNPVARGLIGRGMDAGEIRGTLAALTIAPAAIGGLAYNSYKNKEAEKEKQEQAQGHRDKVAEIIARRNLIREQRGIDPDSLQAQQAERNRLDLEEKRFDLEQKKQKAFLGQVGEKELQPRLGYNHFNAPDKQANFFFGRPKPQGVDWKKGAAVAVGGYGLLSGLNKKRNDDALRINKIKDKEDRAAALDYYNSAQYNVDNVISNIPTALGLSNIVPDTLTHPLIAPTPATKEEEKRDNKPRWTNYRTQAAYSKPEPKQSADFFLPLIAPVIGIVGAGYGLYRKKKEAQKKDEILQAEKLAALDRIQDPELRAGLLSKARGQLIDDTSRTQLVDSALSGDYKSALGIGLKKINFDSK
ncbi:MAG: hypothetical protein IM526_02855 [Microcystis sp. M38BS1]|uniref:hypothetical protein n=1 Tax=Microcystis sp. M38BS1 TaxID=2771188 RepID=UPI0031FBA971|nr:hypothetical protein [Microcystis sp. M38BS1]MCA6582601.1 hypothetical protein [Pseudanabaena sp. M34BS1SP1A06MG]